MLASFTAAMALALLSSAMQPVNTVDGRYHLPENMLAAQGEEAMVRFVPGTLDRASHLLRRLDVLVMDLRARIKTPTPLIGLILSRRHWEEAGFELPYGLPVLIGAGSIAVPAEGDETTARRWKTWLGTDLPPVAGVPMVGTAEHASSLVLADVLLQRAVCAFVLGRVTFTGSEQWIQALLSQFAAYTLFSLYEPTRVPEIEMVYQRLLQNLPVLLAIERDRPPGVERWLLREAQYFEGASLMYGQVGAKGLDRLIKKVRKEKRAITRETLLELHPELEPWLVEVSEDLGVS